VNRRILALGGVALLALASTLPVGGKPAPATGPRVAGVDLSKYSADGPATKTDLLFIHHSCGGQWLAARGGGPNGEGERAPCIYARHPNGGELRARLEAAGYVVHEASYGSDIGDRTDLFDWLPKFRDKMDEILRVDENDRFFVGARRNRVVVFKSCFTNSDFVGAGTPPGDPAGPALTVANAKATMTAVLAELAKRPDVLFVYVTAPPLAGGSVPAWRALARAAKRVLRVRRELPRDESGALARTFDDWMKSPSGWLAGYPRANVVVFDYFDVLTGNGLQNVAFYASAAGDSHPSSAGNEAATRLFVPFVNRALHRFELAGAPADIAR
jgi:hypothetical protein